MCGVYRQAKKERGEGICLSSPRLHLYTRVYCKVGTNRSPINCWFEDKRVSFAMLVLSGCSRVGILHASGFPPREIHLSTMRHVFYPPGMVHDSSTFDGSIKTVRILFSADGYSLVSWPLVICAHVSALPLGPRCCGRQPWIQAATPQNQPSARVWRTFHSPSADMGLTFLSAQYLH